MNIERISNNFFNYELACHRCWQEGKENIVVDNKFLILLQEFRNYVNKPFIVTSGYRCEKHNNLVGGSPTSKHLLGKAVDFFCPYLILKELWQFVERFDKFNGLGSYPSEGYFDMKNKIYFIHIDNDERYARWTRQKNLYTRIV